MQRVVSYFFAVVTGLVLGWYLGNANSTSGSSLPGSPNSASGNLNEFIVAEYRDTTASPKESDQAEVEVEEAEGFGEEPAWSSVNLIDYVNNLDQVAWEKVLRSRQFENLNTQSPELVEELLEQYLDLPQPARSRIFDLVYNAEFGQITSPRDPNKFNTVDWVVSQVKNEQRSGEWLQFLAKTGVHEEQHISYLLDRVESFQSETDTKSILKAVAGSFGSYASGNSDEAMRAIGLRLAKYRASDIDEIRAAAIQSLQSFPTDNKEVLIEHALRDRSSLVRQAAYGAAMNNLSRSETLRNSLLSAMRNQDFPDQERLTAYQYLSTGFVLDDSAYQAVYDFSRDELTPLRKRVHQRLQAEGEL